ncbi:MAG: nitrilase [Rhizobiaceae bacterium MnEN-MB40S]|nr:MAG: nitrilase [Rhizobiaceae bacterium MnEN-MB40S]
MAKHVVAAAHASSIMLDKRASLAKACDLVREAGRSSVELLCFPETFVPGFPYWINLYAPADQHGIYVGYADQSVDLSSDELKPLCDAASEAGVAVVLGLSERAGGTMYNTQAFIGQDGEFLGKHRKLQPTYAERMIWSQGDGATLKVHDMAAGRVGALICYEHMLNLARQALIDQDMQIHCASWPTFASNRDARNAIYDMRVEALMRSHAITGQCFVIVAQNPVTQQNVDAIEAAMGPQSVLGVGGGWSAIIGPTGEYIAEPHTGLEEKLVIAEIDLEAIRSAKVLADTAGHYSRPEVLSLTVDERQFRK